MPSTQYKLIPTDDHARQLWLRFLWLDPNLQLEMLPAFKDLSKLMIVDDELWVFAEVVYAPADEVVGSDPYLPLTDGAVLSSWYPLDWLPATFVMPILGDLAHWPHHAKVCNGLLHVSLELLNLYLPNNKPFYCDDELSSVKVQWALASSRWHRRGCRQRTRIAKAVNP